MKKWSVRIYATQEGKQKAQPVVKLEFVEDIKNEELLFDLPQTNVEGIRLFGIKPINTDDGKLSSNLEDALHRSQKIRVSHTSNSNGIFSRLTSVQIAPLGSIAHWRVAIGRLPSEICLLYDLKDYQKMIEDMECLQINSLSENLRTSQRGVRESER